MNTLARTLLLTAALAALAACGGVGQSPPLPPSDNGYLLTVPLTAADTQSAVEKKYGGEAVVWLEGERAVLRMTAQAVTALQGSGTSLQNTSLDANSTLVAPEAEAAGWNAWGSGWNAWGSGWNAWGSGWNAWGSGSTTSPPAPPSDNAKIWEQIRMNQAYRIQRNGGAGVKVAVLDTGLDTAHPMFGGRLAPSTEWKDYIDGDANPQEGGSTADPAYGHGTAVAGIVLQVAPKATILPIRVLSPSGGGNLDQIIQGIYWAVDRGANVINLSLGSAASTKALLDSVRYAASRGVYVVASAGNNAQLDAVTFPARYGWWADASSGYVMGVGSTDDKFVLSSFTNYGYDLFASAPGEKIVSAFPGSRVIQATGTSFATPLVAGALALAFGETAVAGERAKLFEYMAESAAGGGIFERNWNQRGTDAIGSGILDVENLLQKLPSFSPALAPAASLGSNMGFESGSTGWALAGASVVTKNVRSGTRAVNVAAGGNVSRTFTGLKPKTNYLASVWMRASGFNSYNRPGVWVWGFDSDNRVENSLSVNRLNPSTGYVRMTIAFTTGSSSNSVEIGVWSNGGTVLVDDVSLSEYGN